MAGRHYESDELRMMETMRSRGLSIPVIAKQLGRTPAGIQAALRARGWIDTLRSQIMKSVHIFSSEQKEVFQQFVCARALRSTPSDIREEWNKNAATEQWPMVTNERVIYYLRKSKLQKTKTEYMRFHSYRLRQSIVQRRRRASEHATLLGVLKAKRTELYAETPDLVRKNCHCCRETWPLTKEFFRNAGSSSEYFLNTCKMCYRDLSGTPADRRTQRMDEYDRFVRVKQISAARTERDAFLRQHPSFPTRRCSCCREMWELQPSRFPKYRSAEGSEHYRKTCRFCLRAAARLKERTQPSTDHIPAPNLDAICQLDQ